MLTHRNSEICLRKLEEDIAALLTPADSSFREAFINIEAEHLDRVESLEEKLTSIKRHALAETAALLVHFGIAGSSPFHERSYIEEFRRFDSASNKEDKA